MVSNPTGDVFKQGTMRIFSLFISGVEIQTTGRQLDGASWTMDQDKDHLSTKQE